MKQTDQYRHTFPILKRFIERKHTLELSSVISEFCACYGLPLIVAYQYAEEITGETDLCQLKLDSIRKQNMWIEEEPERVHRSKEFRHTSVPRERITAVVKGASSD